MHVSLRAPDEVCAQKGQVCSPDFIDTLISLIQPNLAEILACIHASLHAQGDLCAQKGPA